MIPIEEFEYEYIHQYFEKWIPKAQALIPLNPRRLPSHVSGSILSQNLASSTDMVTKPLQNLKVAYNYVRDGQNFTHTVKRLGEVAYDTAKINVMGKHIMLLSNIFKLNYNNELRCRIFILY